MSQYLVVITHVRKQDVTEVSLAEHNNVVKAFPSDRTDQPFGICVLPRGPWRCWSVANSYRSESADKDLTIGPIPVTNEIAGSLFPAACFRDLICDPSAVGCAVTPNHRICRRPCPMISIHRAGETRLSARQIDPSPRCRRHDCG